MLKKKLLTGVSIALLCLALPSAGWAEDCAGETPIGPGNLGDCTLDEDTTTELLIEDTGTLFIGASVDINHEIDSTTIASFGTISTNGGGYTINQNAAIGSTSPLDVIEINSNDTWNANASIYTDNSGSDIDMADGLAGGTLNLNNGMTYVGEIDADATDTVNIGADLAGTTITGQGAIQGAAVNVLSGTFVAETDLGAITALASVSVADGATLELSGNATINGALDLDGDVYLSSLTTITTDTYTGSDGDGATITVGISQAGASVITGGIDVTSGGPVDYSADTMTFLMERGTEVIGASGATVNDFFVGNGGATLLPTVVDTSYLYDYDVQQSGDNLDLIITRRSLADATDTPTNQIAAEVILDTLFDTDDRVLEGIQYRLINAPNSKVFNETLESTQPSLDSSAFSVSTYITDQTRFLVQQRMHGLRHEKKIQAASKLLREPRVKNAAANLNDITPAAGGDASIPGYYPIVQSNGQYVIPNKTRELALRRLQALKTVDKRDDKALPQQYRIGARKALNYDNKNYPYENRPIQVWGQVFVGNGKQARRDGIDGYKYNVAATSIGADASSFDRKTILGGYFTYADSEMDAGNANQTNTHMENYLLGFYGSYLFDNDHFFDLTSSISLNDITTNRFNVGGTNYTAVGEYDGQHITLGGEYGKYFEGPYDILFTPAFGVTYSYMEFEDYIERGAQGADLFVQPDAQQRLDIGPSITASTHHAFENGISFMPEASFGYTYNPLQDKPAARAYLRGTAADDATPVEVTYTGFDTQDHLFNMGIGASIATDKWQLLTHYNYQLKEDFDGHIATLKVNYNL